MKNITQLMNKYKECARNLWNVYFLNQLSLCDSFNDNWDICDEFDKICQLLFLSFVLGPIDRTHFNKSCSYESNPLPLRFINVVPKSESKVPIFINREIGAPTGYWDHSIRAIKKNELDLCFVDYYDFDKQGVRDFKYCHVVVDSSSLYPELIGYHALIECEYVEMFFVFSHTY